MGDYYTHRLLWWILMVLVVIAGLLAYIAGTA